MLRNLNATMSSSLRRRTRVQKFGPLGEIFTFVSKLCPETLSHIFSKRDEGTFFSEKSFCFQTKIPDIFLFKNLFVKQEPLKRGFLSEGRKLLANKWH